MGKIILEIIILMIIAIGVISIFDARNISKRYFSNSDRNSSVRLLRICGFILSLIGVFIIYVL